eukprot:CAMPEP_0185829560 /NCGR_PEP_ID=MMETSP1353-20130828/322_1 /TAXON_ID=1077150 /ORGANISM="Erythrolobus australicus, Strain CCMP3124" /LENGTH=88 /DNA_ID=CAMNT_0028527363 /DNA_START=690 /DNA_END=953 /DNA_ORIENTATION=+
MRVAKHKPQRLNAAQPPVHYRRLQLASTPGSARDLTHLGMTSKRHADAFHCSSPATTRFAARNPPQPSRSLLRLPQQAHPAPSSPQSL